MNSLKSQSQTKLALRKKILADFQAPPATQQELLAYNCNYFDHEQLSFPLQLPLPDEPFVAAWRQYLKETERTVVFLTLAQKLVQLQFPIKSRISQTEAYQQATRKGIFPAIKSKADKLQLRAPQGLELRLHQSPAGVIPVLIARNREDFITLIQALIRRNEPDPIPASMGA